MSTSQARACAIINSKLLISFVGAPISEVHYDILKVLSDAFRVNIFAEFIPELLDVSFLGPDPEAPTLSGAMAVAINGSSYVSKTLVVALSIGCSALMLIFV